MLGNDAFTLPGGRPPWIDAPLVRVLPQARAAGAQIGYGRVKESIFDALDAAGGIEWVAETSFEYDYRLYFGWPRSWMLGKGGVYEDAIIHTMFESEAEPEGWVDVLNRFGLIWTPSQWCKLLFEQWGVERPIMVSGYGVDAEKFPYLERRADCPFTFLTLGHALHGRKGQMATLKAFMTLKRKGELGDARLLVKLQQGCIKNIRAPDVYFHFGTMPQDEYVQLMQLADILIYPHVGEGFGLIPLEFMSTGGTALVTDYSGVQEYLNADCMTALPVGWDESVLMEQMVWAYKNRDEVLARGRMAAEYVRREWTWFRAGLRARWELYRNLGR